jgi:aminoglycoside 3-N-acetyltransferase
MLHSGFSRDTGFRGTVDAFTDAILDALGPHGTFVMPSLSYRGAALDYLSKLEIFDVRKTPSMMGLVSEFFRRRDDVLRSVNPMHPVVATGRDAEWLVAGHEDAVYSCGAETPWSRLVDIDSKVIFFDTAFASFTFFHHIEHEVSPKLPFSLYAEPPFDVPVRDREGNLLVVRTHAFSREAIRRRRFAVFEEELRQRGLIKSRRLGNTTLMLIRVRDALGHAKRMIKNGRYFHDVSAESMYAGYDDRTEGSRER